MDKNWLIKKAVKYPTYDLIADIDRLLLVQAVKLAGPLSKIR
jgi:hypothetical protein